MADGLLSVNAWRDYVFNPLSSDMEMGEEVQEALQMRFIDLVV